MSELNFWLTFLHLIARDLMVHFRLAKPLDLMPFLSHSNPKIRWHAADLLYFYEDSRLINPVFNLLQNEPDAHVRKRLLWTLETCKAWDQIFACLELPADDVRSTVANILSQSGERRFIAPLLERMIKQHHPDYIYRLALKGLVDKSSVAILSESLAKAPSADTKRVLLNLLGYTKNNQVFEQLMKAIDDPNDKVRLGAVLGLDALGDDRAIRAFQKLLTDPSEEIRDRSQAALKEFSRNQA